MHKGPMNKITMMVGKEAQLHGLFFTKSDLMTAIVEVPN